MVLDASLNVPKLYEGKEIRDLASGGLNQEPLRQGFPDIINFLKCL